MYISLIIYSLIPVVGGITVIAIAINKSQNHQPPKPINKKFLWGGIAVAIFGLVQAKQALPTGKQTAEEIAASAIGNQKFPIKINDAIVIYSIEGRNKDNRVLINYRIVKENVSYDDIQNVITLMQDEAINQKCKQQEFAEAINSGIKYEYAFYQKDKYINSFTLNKSNCIK